MFINWLIPISKCECEGCDLGSVSTFSFRVHKVVLDDNVSHLGLAPFVNITVAGKSRQTGFGVWSAEHQHWWFNEVVVTDGCRTGQVEVALYLPRRVDLLVTSVSLNPECCGTAQFPVSTVQLMSKEWKHDMARSLAAPTREFAFMKDDVKVGSVQLSFHVSEPVSLCPKPFDEDIVPEWHEFRNVCDLRIQQESPSRALGLPS